MAADVSSHHGDTEALVTDMHNLNHVTDASLAVMLQRARKLRQIRHTLAVVARLRPILELTSKMKINLLLKNYDTLAIEYTRLKHQSAKLVSLAPPLKRIVLAGHNIAATANTELLQKLEDMTASVTNQKHTISVLTELGLAEKPILICITKQLEYLERKLSLDENDASQNVASPSLPINSENIINECVAGVARFHNGLWDFICELFKTPAAGNMAISGKAVTSFEAERVQQKAWIILSKCVELLERHTLSPSAKSLKLLSEVFRQLRSLRKCPNANTLNANLIQLNESFCIKFRMAVVLEFLKQECLSAQSGLLTEYFEPIVTVLPSFSSVDSIAASIAYNHSLVMSTDPQTKVQRLILEVQQAFDATKNTSRISSESKILLHRPQVFTTCATDILRKWEGIWKNVGHVLLNVLNTTDCTSTVVSGSTDPDAQFRSQVIQHLEKHLREMLSEFLEKLVAAFVAEITSLAHGQRDTCDENTHIRSEARACILLAIVANCIEFREKCLRTVDGWVMQLKYGNFGEDAYKSLLQHGRAATSTTQALSNLVQSVESKCMDLYSSSHIALLKKSLQCGAAEEPFQPCSSRYHSLTNRTGSVGISASLVMQTSASNPVHSTVMPSDPRQYVFNVLLQLITLRSDVETSVGAYPQCWDYIQIVTDPLVAALAEFLKTSARELKISNILNRNEWILYHLIVEVRFFQLALSDLMMEGTRVQLEEIERQLVANTAGNEATITKHDPLLNQLKHQTKLYLLALQH